MIQYKKYTRTVFYYIVFCFFFFFLTTRMTLDTTKDFLAYTRRSFKIREMFIAILYTTSLENK